MSTNYRLFRFLPIILSDIPGVGVCVCVCATPVGCMCVLGILVQAKSAELTADLFFFFLATKFMLFGTPSQARATCKDWMAVFKVKVPDGCVQSEGSRWLCSK